ncbi:MAG: amidohydrolase family protein [Actinomycetes bacterium]
MSELRPGATAQASDRLVDRLLLRDWRPRPRLCVPETAVLRPAFPVVDAHNHVGRWLSADGDWLAPDVDDLLALLDEAGVATLVNLDGRWGADLEANLERYDRAHPDRFATFCHVDWARLTDDDDRRSSVGALQHQLEVSAAAGARGVKVWKDLGLAVRGSSGELVSPDDSRVIEVLRAAGELGLPVLIHTADPVAFFDPLDATNERVDELGEQPGWWFGGPGMPTFDKLMFALENLVAACPGTTFVGAHVGCWAEDLAAVGGMLGRRANWNVDLGGRLGEIGRQPRTFATFVADFPDRVLFGTDAFPPDLDEYRRYYRFLETSDDHFSYSGDSVPPQGRWSIYGCALSERLLEGVYSGNARRILGLA